MIDSRLDHILNLQAKVEYTIIEPGSPEFQNHLDFLDSYEGRFRKNYNRQHLEAFIRSHNRFNLGAVLIYIDGILSRSFMIENYKNWLLLSRQITHEYPKFPIFTAMVYEPLLEISSKYNLRGIFASFNSGNKYYIRCLRENFSHKMAGDSPIYNKHNEIMEKIKKIDNPVSFMNTQQIIAYIELTGEIDEIFDNNSIGNICQD